VDLLHSRGNMQRNVRELTATHVRVAGLRPFRGLGRAWLAAAFASLGLLACAWFSFVELPQAFTSMDTPQGQVIQSVAIGSRLWLVNVRPQDPVAINPVTGRFQVSMPNYGLTGGEMHRRGNFAQDLLLGTMLVLASALLAAGRLPGAAAAAGAGVAIALAPALPELGFPAAIPLTLLSAGTAVAAMRIPNRSLQRRFDTFGIAAAALIVVGALALMRELDFIDWSIVWGLPLAIAIALGVIGEAIAVRARLRNAPRASPGSGSRLLSAIVPLAASSRLEGADDERSRLAIELHNSVLPRVQSSARAIRDELSLEKAAQRLEGLATELREVMQRNETVSLEIGGLAEALRVHAGSLDSAGVRLTFEVNGVAERRPPAKVELAAYRIGQAAIDNALRHAGADHVEVVVTSGPELVELTVRDDGVGLDATAEGHARRTGRLGLAQMRVRAEAVGGSLDVNGTAGKGTVVRFVWAA
jgi:signal transduction histidine kinase